MFANFVEHRSQRLKISNRALPAAQERINFALQARLRSSASAPASSSLPRTRSTGSPEFTINW